MFRPTFVGASRGHLCDITAFLSLNRPTCATSCDFLFSMRRTYSQSVSQFVSLLFGVVHVRVAEAPSSLRHFLVVDGSNNITANISWNTPLSDAPITAYQITWAQLNALNRQSFTVPGVVHFSLRPGWDAKYCDVCYIAITITIILLINASDVHK